MIDPTRVLVLYTGGTLGMVPGPRGYAPVAGHLARQLAAMPQFHDAAFEATVPKARATQFTTPPSAMGRRAAFDLLEYSPLIDSSNMRREGWVQIARDIERHYDAYDAFVVLHGTDTMAYTASALSFMLVNLDKTVILTGSQIPLSHVRNDAVDNLLGALTLATQHTIPEVGLYFRSQLWRGNRARKTDAAGFNAFQSGNFGPLATVGIGLDVRWSLVRTPSGDPLRVRPITNDNVAALRLFPGLTAQTLDRVLRAPLQGVVLETYGSGNAPDDDPELLAVLRRATDDGLVVVNVTQCLTGRVAPDYATGQALLRAGVTPGADLTPEAALTKLSYLLSLDLSVDEVRTKMQVNLRGELTPPAPERTAALREQTFVEAVARTLGEAGLTGVAGVGAALYPVLMCAAAQRGDVPSLARMLGAGASALTADYDGRTPLHLAAAEGHLEAVSLLLGHGADPLAADRHGERPIDAAAAHEQVLSTLQQASRP